jgi:hypothetical protein
MGEAGQNDYCFVLYSGGGVESPANYPQWKVEHARFESPAAIQASFSKLLDGMRGREGGRKGGREGERVGGREGGRERERGELVKGCMM